MSEIVTMERSGLEEGSLQNPQNNDRTTPQIQDIITEDGILCSILSHLSLREAVATCVLSPRWRQLWTNCHKLCFSVDTMFDANTVRLMCAEDTPLTEKEIIELAKGKRIQFIQSINSVLQQLQDCGGVDEFRLRYFLHRKHSHHLDAWVRFALSANTKVLALLLHKPYHRKPIRREPIRRAYDFPSWLLERPSSLEYLALQGCSLKPPCNFDGLANLKILKLYCIDLIEEDITRLLANCRTLEKLVLDSSLQLTTLSIPHPLSQLHKLVVRHCCKLRKIDINAVNLRRLIYFGFPADFMLSQSSHLEDVVILFITESSSPTLDFYLTQLSRNLPQLPSLVFQIGGDLGVPKMLKSPRGSDRFNHLTRLRWFWTVRVKMSLLDLATVMDAFPILEEFRLTLRMKCTAEEPPTENLAELQKRIPERPHTHLKTVELRNFYYETWQIKIALYLFKNAIQLESMTIKEDRRGLDQTQRVKLSQLAPPKVKLLIPVINV